MNISNRDDRCLEFLISNVVGKMGAKWEMDKSAEDCDGGRNC